MLHQSWPGKAVCVRTASTAPAAAPDNPCRDGAPHALSRCTPVQCVRQPRGRVGGEGGATGCSKDVPVGSDLPRPSPPTTTPTDLQCVERAVVMTRRARRSGAEVWGASHSSRLRHELAGSAHRQHMNTTALRVQQWFELSVSHEGLWRHETGRIECG